MELVTFHFNSVNVYCVCKQNNRHSSISCLACLSVGKTAGTYQNLCNETVLENYAFLFNLYYTQPFYRTSTFGQNHAYCIRIFTVHT